MTRWNSWTLEEETWLREVYPEHYNVELAEMHASAFPDRPRRSWKAISSHAKNRGLHKAEGFERVPRRFWTQEKEAWFRSFVPGHTQAEISAEHERLYGEPLTRCQIAGAKSKFGVKSGTPGYRWEVGNEPHNKGKTWDEIMPPESQERCRAGQFKKGNLSGYALQRQQPVGSERVNRDGYIEVKVGEGLQSKPNKNFRMKHHVVYEQAYGSIPRGCNVVFADGDKRNFDPGNLVAVPRRLLSTINREGWGYHDRESLEVCMNLARLRHEIFEAACSPRPCKRCGAVFKPRYPHLKTCDACLGRCKGKEESDD